MPEWGWVVVAGLVLAILTPPILASIRYVRNAVVTAGAKSLAKALVPELQVFFQDHLKKELEDMQEDITYIKGELTINGGESVKDGIHRIEQQVEALFTDR